MSTPSFQGSITNLFVKTTFAPIAMKSLLKGNEWMDSEFWRYVENAKYACSFPARLRSKPLWTIGWALRLLVLCAILQPFFGGIEGKTWESQTDLTKIIIKTICSYYGGRDLWLRPSFVDLVALTVNGNTRRPPCIWPFHPSGSRLFRRAFVFYPHKCSAFRHPSCLTGAI